MKSSKKLVKISIEYIEDRMQQKSISGVPSGFVKIDEFTDGWQPGQLIVIAARPGMGRNAFTRSMILNAAIRYNQGVAVFSLESSAKHYTNMMIVSETKIPHHKISRGKLEMSEYFDLKKKVTKLSKALFFIDDTPSISLTKLKKRLIKLKSEHDIKLVVIDYLQLMTFQKLSIFYRTQEIDIISRNLKKLAKELNLAIIVLSQLSSSVDKRKKDRRPRLSDLKEITSIERYADLVAFIYRPDYYGFDILENKKDSTKHLAELIIAKNRNGLLNDFRIKFDIRSASYSDIDKIKDTISQSI